jgi:hypothetical protein
MDSEKPFTDIKERKKYSYSWIILALAGGILLLPPAVLYIWIYCKCVYYNHAYEPSSVVAKGGLERRPGRFNDYRTQFALFSLEWNTYDNDKLYKPPYKLVIRISTVHSSVDSISLDKVTISSSLGNSYQIQPPSPLPMVLFPPANKRKYSYTTFEPAFDFQFHDKEKIELTLEFTIRTSSGSVHETIRDTFVPVRIKSFHSLV